jgi:hypothetical protein
MHQRWSPWTSTADKLAVVGHPQAVSVGVDLLSALTSECVGGGT